MKKVIFNPGTKINLSDELNDLQDYAYDNAYNLVDLLLENTGVLCDTVSGIITPTDTSLKPTILLSGPNIDIYPGFAICPSGLLLYSNTVSDYTTTSLGLPVYTSGLYYIYAQYSGQVSVAVPKIAGFLYNPSGTSTVYTRNEIGSSRNFNLVLSTSLLTGAANDISVLLGSGYWAGLNEWDYLAGGEITDLRTPLRINSDLFPYEVFRKYGEFSNVGSIKTTKLGIQSYDESTILWINNSGITNATITASGIKEAHDYRHVAGTETTFVSGTLTAAGHTILTNYNAIQKGTGYSSSNDRPTASQELSRLFRQGIINFDGRTDGVNDRRLVTTLIPSMPGIPVNVSGMLIESSTDSTFSTELNAALINYNLKDLVKTQKNEGYSLTNAFYSEVQRVAAENSYTTMSGFYTYSGVVYLGSQIFSNSYYPYTLVAAASGIANGGYGITVSGLGFTLPSGNGYYTGAAPTFVTRINETLTSLDSAISSAERDRLDAATSILSKTNRLELTPSSARKQYRCRITWSGVTPINNEQIKYYNIRVYKLNPVTQNAVVAGSTIVTIENDFNKVLEMKDDTTYIKRKTLETIFSGTPSSVTQSGVSAYSGTILWDTNYNSYNVRVGDIITAGGSNYFVTFIYNNSGLLLDRYAVASPIPVTVKREVLESSTKNTNYDFDIYADQYYCVYVRAVTEYDIAGDWSTGIKLSTNSLTNATNDTLQNLVSRDELLLAKTNEARNVVYTQKLNSQITALQRQVEDTPTRTTVDNLVTRVTQLDTPA